MRKKVVKVVNEKVVDEKKRIGEKESEVEMVSEKERVGEEKRVGEKVSRDKMLYLLTNKMQKHQIN